MSTSERQACDRSDRTMRMDDRCRAEELRSDQIRESREFDARKIEPQHKKESREGAMQSSRSAFGSPLDTTQSDIDPLRAARLLIAVYCTVLGLHCTALCS